MISGSLPHTHRCRCIQSRLQSHAKRRFELNPFPLTLASHVGKMFCFTGIDWQIFWSRVFADDHPCVNVLLWADEKPAALLNVVERVSRADSRFHRHHDTPTASSDFAFERGVFAKEMIHQTF